MSINQASMNMRKDVIQVFLMSLESELLHLPLAICCSTYLLVVKYTRLQALNNAVQIKMCFRKPRKLCVFE